MTVLGEKLELHCTAKAVYTLMITKVSRSHQRRCYCRATSEINSIQTSVHLTVKYPESCSIIRTFVTRISGSYVIAPDGVGGVDLFVVYCNMTERDHIGVTIVSHDSEDRILVDGCESKGCYSRRM